MIPLLIGGVTLAAVGYAIKEYCEEEGCPWENMEKTYTTQTQENTPYYTISKEFHKFKKKLYKKSMKEYKEFLEKNAIDNDDAMKYVKIEKELIENHLISSALESYIDELSFVLNTLSYNLKLSLKLLEKQENVSNANLEQINTYVENIDKLSHLKLLDKSGNVNTDEILECLVQATGEPILKEAKK